MYDPSKGVESLIKTGLSRKQAEALVAAMLALRSPDFDEAQWSDRLVKAGLKRAVAQNVLAEFARATVDWRVRCNP